MVFRKAEFVTALQATRNAAAVKTKTVHGLKKTIKVQLLMVRSPPPPWREKDGLKRLLRRREKLRYARVLSSWFASTVHLVFKKGESTAKPNDRPSNGS